MVILEIHTLPTKNLPCLQPLLSPRSLLSITLRGEDLAVVLPSGCRGHYFSPSNSYHFLLTSFTCDEGTGGLHSQMCWSRPKLLSTKAFLLLSSLVRISVWMQLPEWRASSWNEGTQGKRAPRLHWHRDRMGTPENLHIWNDEDMFGNTHVLTVFALDSSWPHQNFSSTNHPPV